MHMAAAGGHLEVIKFLSPKFGARVHEKDNNWYTVLHWAALRGHCEMARYLIEELKMDPQDRDKVCRVPWEGKICSKVQGLRASYMCVQVLVCKAKHVLTKQVSPGHIYVRNMVRENSPVL